MKQTLLQRLGLAGAPAPQARGTTIIHEDPGSGAGAVLFQPYRVAEFVPDAQPPADAQPRLETRPSGDDAGPRDHDAADAANHDAARHAPNPVAEDWRRTSPEMFQAVAHRFCARAPKATAELRSRCLAGDRQQLGRLAESLKPTLSLFDMAAAEAARRVQAMAGEASPGDLAYEVLALEHEIWRVVEHWQAGERLEDEGQTVAGGAP